MYCILKVNVYSCAADNFTVSIVDTGVVRRFKGHTNK